MSNAENSVGLRNMIRLQSVIYILVQISNIFNKSYADQLFYEELLWFRT